MEINIEIDEITNCLKETSTGKECEMEYHLIDKPISKKKAIELKRKGWLFDWSLPQKNGNLVYELTLKDKNEIQGLIAMRPQEDARAIYVEHVESAPHNRKKLKKFKGVGAHLFAIACKISFENSYEGYVMFDSKTNLISYYEERLKALRIGPQRMELNTSSAQYLIDNYYDKEDRK